MQNDIHDIYKWYMEKTIILLKKNMNFMNYSPEKKKKELTWNSPEKKKSKTVALFSLGKAFFNFMSIVLAEF